MTPIKTEQVEATEIDWSMEMTKNLIEVLMDVTLCSNVNELKNHIILECIWKEVEKKLKIDHKALKDFWTFRLHMQLFSPHPIYLNNIKIQLIEYLYTKELRSSNKKDINWRNLCSHFDGFTRPFLYRIYNNLMIVAKSNVSSSTLSDLITYLFKEYIPYLIKQEEDKILPRLSYRKKKLEWVDTDELYK